VFCSAKIGGGRSGLRVSLDAVGGRPNIEGTVFWLTVKAEAGFVLPLRMPVSHMTCWNTRSPETEVGGSNNGNADLSIDIATHLRVRFLPFLRKES
jgi:hypothetical protein